MKENHPSGAEVILTDLGLTTKFGSQDKHRPDMPWRITAPEGKKGEWSSKCDVYSFGLLMWTTFAHQPPWSGVYDAGKAELSRFAEHHPRPKAVPAVLWRLFEECVSVDPSERPDMPSILEILGNEAKVDLSEIEYL